MSDSTAPTVGYIASLRNLGSGLLDGAHDHFELFTIELQEEKLRFFQTLMWIGAGFFAAMLLSTFLAITIVYLVPESARPITLVSMTVVFLLALGGIVWGFRRHLRRQERPFAGTLNELQKDSACIRRES